MKRPPQNKECREILAIHAHEAWSRWMKHLFERSIRNDDGTVTLATADVARWTQQATTDYQRLSAGEQESDLAEADRILVVLEQAGVLVQKEN